MDTMTRAVIRNQLYLRGMSQKQLAEAIEDNYSMVRQVMSGNLTHKRIERKILNYMNIKNMDKEEAIDERKEN